VVDFLSFAVMLAHRTPNLSEHSMSILRRSLISAFTFITVVLLPGALVAQQHDMAGDDGASTFGEDFPHGVTFWTRREPAGCWLCAPAVDFNAGRWSMKDATASTFLRVHTQWGLGIRHLAMSADALWIPHLTHSTPRISFVAQVEPISQAKRLYVSAGLGMVSNGSTSGQGFGGWAQGVVAFRSPIHDLAPFIQAGRILSGSNRETEFLFGIAHPIAPYRMHYTIK
jgi:hypothetical protein